MTALEGKEKSTTSVSAKEWISSLAFVVLGLAVSYSSIDLGLGTGRLPGPGFLPFWSGVFLLAIASILFVSALRKKSAGSGQPAQASWSGIRWKNILIVLAALVLYALIFEKLGFLISAFLLMFFLFKGVEPQRFWVAVVASLLTVFMSYLIFSYWLGVQFPKGLLPI